MAKKIVEVTCLKLLELALVLVDNWLSGRFCIPSCDAWDHRTASHSLDEEEEWHDREHIMVGGEWHKPVNHEVMRPY